MENGRTQVAVFSRDDVVVGEIRRAAIGAGMDFSIYSSPVALLDRARSGDLSLVFVDSGGTVLDIDAAETIVRHLKEETPWVFRVVLARETDPATEFRFRRHGILYYLTLPFDDGEVPALLSVVSDDNIVLERRAEAMQ